MIVGLGIDLVELARIRRSLERFGELFLHKLLHPSERNGLEGLGVNVLAQAGPDKAETAAPPVPERLTAFTAARFAAKEAGAKALGTGFSGGIGLHDIRILSLPTGRPIISFHGQALAAAEALGVSAAHLSISHARETAGAVVVLEAGSR